MSLKVLSKLSFGGKTALAVEGNCANLKNGDTVTDEHGNSYVIVSVGMTHYEDPKQWKTMAQLLIDGSEFEGEKLVVGE